MKSCPTASGYTLLFLFIITLVESNALPLTIRRRSFDHSFPPALQTVRHALISPRMLVLLPRNHESQDGYLDAKYDSGGGGYRDEEGIRDSSREPQQDDRYGNEGEMETTGMSHDHRHSSSGPGDWNERTSGTLGGPDERMEDEQYGPYSNGSPGDSEANHFPSGYSNAPTSSGSRPEHNHQVPGNTNDTLESDEVPASPQMHPTEDQPHESNPVSQGEETSPEEATLSDQVAPSSANEGHPSMACSTLSQLYQRLDGPAWYNQGGWKDTTVPHRIRTRDHDGSRESQYPFRTTGQTEAGADDVQDEGQVDESSINRGTTGSDRNENPMVVKEDSSGPACCSWFGVTCRGSRVVGLALAENGLDGPYPTDIVQSMVDLETV